MKRLLLASALSLGLAAPVAAQERGATDYIMPLGYCQLTSVSSATLISTCSGGIPARTVWAVICVETAAIRWRDDGTSPTASVGMPLAAGSSTSNSCMYYSGTMSALSVIAQTGSPVVDISFYSGAPRT